ncbi:hypothetical protein VT84_32080 [Gemmata sp. SH-PL17]|nr:hypothetical protein VT84_32080 [Gemmata sp. SH-PL17]
MERCRYSSYAIASCVLNLPWAASFGWCLWVSWTANGRVAGEIFLLPVMAWFWTGLPAGACGFVAWMNIRSSPARLRGRWLALLGMLLAAVIPVLGVAENLWSTYRQKQINSERHRPAEPSAAPTTTE